MTRLCANKTTIITASMSAFFGESYSTNPFGYVSPYEYERRRILEESRRRRAEIQYRRQLEERERKRQAAALDYQRRLAQENALRRQHRLQQLNDEDQESDPYYIVRGADGCLYRVPAQNAINSNHHPKQDAREPTSKSEVHEPQRGDQSLSHIPSLSETQHASNVQDALQSKVTEHTCSERMHHAATTEDMSVDESRSDVPITADVVVEDASDDEEEKEIRSIWRNRRPSPGTLMEPVEAL